MGLAIGQVWKLTGPRGRPCADMQAPKRYGRRVGQTKLNLADCPDDHLGGLQARFEHDRLLHAAYLSLGQFHHRPREGMQAIGDRTIGSFEYSQAFVQP